MSTATCPKCAAPDSRECRCSPDEQWECSYGQKDCPGGAACTCALPPHSALIADLRKLHAEITACDGHESEMMALVRRAADALECSPGDE